MPGTHVWIPAGSGVYSNRTQYSGTLYGLTVRRAQSLANSLATKARFAIGGSITTIQFSPENVATAAATIPASGNTKMGWILDTPLNATKRVRIDTSTPQGYYFLIQVYRSGQLGEIDTSCQFDYFVYATDNAGNPSPTQPGKSAGDPVLHMTFTGTVTTAGTILGPDTTMPDVYLNADGRLEVELYITPLLAGIPTPPASNLDVICITDPHDSSGSLDTGVQFSRDAAGAVTTYAILTDTAVAVVSPTVATQSRLVAATEKLAVVSPTVTTLAKNILKPLSVVSPTVAKGRIDMPFADVPAAGGSTIKRIVQVFED